MNEASLTSMKDFEDTPQGWQQYWLAELAAGKKSTDKFAKHGDRITKIYLDERGGDMQAMVGGARLNLFTANVNTMRAMLFGNVPRVEVSRRYEDANDDAARVAAEMLERLLNADIGKQFSFAIGSALDDKLLVGLGMSKVRYTANFQSIQHDAIMDPLTGAEQAPAYEEQKKTFEAAPVDYVNWRDVMWSPARTWDEVRWIGFKNYMTRDQLVQRFGETIGNAVPLGTSRRSITKGGIKNDPWQRGEVWEVWCLEYKTVYWIVEGMDVICDKQEDPLQIEGFFPCPQPMVSNLTTGNFMPRADYVLSQDQYEEVNDVTSRIMLLEKAIKVVGVYDKSAVGVQRMLSEAMQNELIPVDNWAMFAEKGGLKGQTDWLPLDQVVGALNTLREYRAELITLLFQSSGMSDILRGATVQGETATAQSIKAKFASVRVQYAQDEFARFATDLQKLRAQVMIKHFDDATLVQAANMQNTPDAQHLPQALELLRSQFAVFRVAIKSETLAAQDMAAIRQEKTEFIQGLATFLQAAQPMIDKYPATAPTLLEMLKWTMSGFKGASQIEGVLDQAIAGLQQNPPQPQPNPAEAKAKEAQAKEAAKLQSDQQRTQMDTAAYGAKKKMDVQAEAQVTQIQTQGKIREQAAQQLFSTASEMRQMDVGPPVKRPPQ
jgi:hypothetical protein